jgi:hypothetical protein
MSKHPRLLARPKLLHAVKARLVTIPIITTTITLNKRDILALAINIQSVWMGIRYSCMNLKSKDFFLILGGKSFVTVSGITFLN